MATTTPNFGWSVPTSTDLVKDGATAIELLGDSIDASLVDLKGGTTGQVLSKASNADMDFTWVTDAAGDITGVTAGTGISGGGTSGTVTVTNSMATAIDAKGDLIGGTGADTFSRLAVGANGTVLTADSAEATGLKWATASSGALTCVKAETAFSAVSSITADSVFSGTYTNYRIIFNYTTSTTSSILMKLRASGTSTSTNYNYQFFEVNGTSVSGARSTGATSFNITEWTNGAFNSTVVVDVFNPQVATGTTIQAHGDISLGAYTTPFIKNSYGNQSASTQFDGVEIAPGSGTITGTYTIYGFGKTL